MQDLKRMAKAYPALNKIKQKSIDKMAAKLEILYGLPVFFVDTETQYFNKIIELAEMVDKSANKKVMVKSKVTIKKSS